MKRRREHRRIFPRTAAAALVIAGAIALAVATRSKPAPAASVPAPAPSAFLPTTENTTRPSQAAPEGMVWIPGGEFSMGAADPTGTDNNGVGMRATDDSRPIH